MYFRCKISTVKTETISSRYFNPLRKSNFWQASQDFDPLFFNDLVHHHSRCWWYTHTTVKHSFEIRCSRSSVLLPLGSFFRIHPSMSKVFRFGRSIAIFIKARNRKNFCHALVVIFYPLWERKIERNAMHNSIVLYGNYSYWSNDLEREKLMRKGYSFYFLSFLKN